MSIDFNMLKKLILLFAKLDEEDQIDILTHTLFLSARQTQKGLYTQKDHKTDEDFHYRDMSYERAIKEKGNIRLTEIKLFFEQYDQLDDHDKAILIAATNQLSGGALTKETDIEIKLSHKKISLESLLKEVIPGANFEKAIKDADNYIKEYKKAQA